MPNKQWINKHIGETRLNNAGLKITITGGKSTDCEITFEDGSITKHRLYKEFKQGKVAHPKGNWIMQHFGETKLNNAGLKMTIIDGIASDCTIKFEDESIVEHTNYKLFIRGAIAHPKGNGFMQHINETKNNNSGLKMTITNYKKHDDITVQFEDGSIIEHTDYSSFKNGRIAHPKGNWIKTHKHRKKYNNIGIKMSIIDGTATDTTILFEDGSIIKHKMYGTFKNGQIGHPLYPSPYKDKKPTEIGCITRKKIAYKTDTCHYYCTCNVCQHDDIWNWKEIHEHNALHGIPKKDLIFIEPNEIKDEKQPNPDENPQL